MIFPTLKETLKQTTSRCPTCQAAVPAEVWKTTGTLAKVDLKKTWDQDSIDRCWTHVIQPDRMLDSFCRYYSGGGK